MVEVVRCKDCKYWSKTHHSEVYDIHKCDKALMLWDSTKWAEDDETGEFSRVYIEEAKDNLMFVQDASDYRANLFTKADFFCAHGEK